MSRRSNKKAGPGKAADVHSSAPVSPVGKIPSVEDFRLLESKCRPAGLNERWTVLGVCVFLSAITWMVFGRTLGHEFVNFDDNLYVYENPVVQKGLTWEGFRWALTYGQIGHWHPLTWLSHMLDCQLYGLNAGGHHLTNVLLHTASVILLFLVLRRMTGKLWRSALVAAVFAIHPLRAESVAWVAERKDVLSALFFMLTLGAYARYAQGRSRVEGRESSAGSGSLALDARRWTLDYCLVVLFFALGLLSKNMLVTLPFVLLLLDYWPLGRFSGFTPRILLRLVVEKLPMFMLTVGSCVVTALVPEKMTSGRLGFGLRLENAVVSYVTYLWEMIHPSGLACLYPNPVNHLPLWQVAGAVGLLLALTGAAWVFRRTQPWLVVGWLWYVGMLIPVIGVMQISYYAHADRYTYLPEIGMYLLLTWGVAELCAGWRHRRLVLGGLSTVILAALIFCARTQVSYWRNSETLWIHTLACTSGNYTAQNNLGDILFQKGEVDEAIVQYQTALKIKPDYPNAHYNLGNALLTERRVDEAIGQYQTALKIKPNYAEAHDNLGNVLFQRGRVDEAISHYQTALKIKPNNAKARNNLGNALLLKGRAGDAIAQYQKALEIKPAYPEVLNNLARVLATFPQVSLRNGGKAVELAQRANQLVGGQNPVVLHTLAAAYAEAGRFGDAIRTAQKAVELAPAAGQKELAAQLNSELKLYEAGLPFHEKSN
jgi:tetratricopeptide (TPR) repeat protein